MTAGPALHVRGVVLPDEIVRDLWLVGDRVTFEPVPGARTVVDGGFVLPGLVDAHCHIGIRKGG
ncbi:MAG: amidohydrolase, partial [Longispora sp.]|nr:amidohydrolase [Longispora sp. (in: high G+C Gram-positive bacteria)]